MKTLRLIPIVCFLCAALTPLAPAQSAGLSYSPDPNIYGQHPGQLGYSGWCYLRNNDSQRISVVVNAVSRHSGQQTMDDVAYFGTFVLDPGEQVPLDVASWYWLTDATGEIGFDTFDIASTTYVTVNPAPTVAWTDPPGTVASGQTYTISAHGHDAGGDLALVNVWKNGAPFAFAGGGNGTDGDSGNPSTDTGPQTVTFTAQAVDATGATSPLITQTVVVAAPVNTPPVVTLIAPGAQTIAAGTTLTITSSATDPDGNITNHKLDVQRPAGDWNFQGGFAFGEPFQGGPVGSGSASTRSASFTFTDSGTYHVRSAANDGSGWYHSATVDITVLAPVVLYALVTSTGAGGAVSAGGTFPAGTLMTVTATPDGTHDFAGWSGDAGGNANPLGVLLDRGKTVQANFSPKVFSLTTSATAGGSVTPGGSYPFGTSLTLSAVADATHRFTGWTGDASGPAASILVTVNRVLSVQAVFAGKTGQTLSFPPPGNLPVGSPPIILGGSASSGLPVIYSVLSGPATITANQLSVTGPGAITVQASQPGDAFYLPAASLTQTFNAVAAALLKYLPGRRTQLRDRAVTGTAPFVLQSP